MPEITRILKRPVLARLTRRPCTSVWALEHAPMHKKAMRELQEQILKDCLPPLPGDLVSHLADFTLQSRQ